MPLKNINDQGLILFPIYELITRLANIYFLGKTSQAGETRYFEIKSKNKIHILQIRWRNDL